MIKIIYRGCTDSNVYLDDNNSLAQLVAAAKSCNDDVYLRTEMMTVRVKEGSVTRA